MMSRTLMVVAFLGWVVVVGGTLAHAGTEIDLQDGMWEITSQVNMQGMTVPPVTFSQCITKENAVPQSSSPGQEDCTITDMQTVGSTVSWTMQCNTQGGAMTGKGKITYHGDRFDGEMKTETMGMVMITKMSGKRTGPCK
ncbi:DUF3617 domain-containing protein [Desulfosarcina ovata]|uniref:Lipoprotein n=2 Tax=Desulfosarcina ovata TaxID=83564 RepID=A0A5K8A5S3_9BACT|nr:DUF3617 family protein [Desulfosarcina ovata]BBO80596.1 lipoprotein [Desulfosarcina ovata subsp. sediminis]BBO87806.1 lipoprotein [Desulfosarcina ovata subsp. ovata]